MINEYDGCRNEYCTLSELCVLNGMSIMGFECIYMNICDEMLGFSRCFRFFRYLDSQCEC